MAQISLSKRENDFLRELLLGSMRHYTREIDADVTLLSTCEDGDDMQEVYRKMLCDDKSRLCNAKGIYEKLLIYG